MDHNIFYPNTTSINQLSLTWKALIVIGSISTVIFLILLVIIVSLMFESKLVKKEQEHDLSEYDDFLNEFANGKTENEEEYPSLPKIRDFDGNYLRNLMQIDVL